MCRHAYTQSRLKILRQIETSGPLGANGASGRDINQIACRSGIGSFRPLSKKFSSRPRQAVTTSTRLTLPIRARTILFERGLAEALCARHHFFRRASGPVFTLGWNCAPRRLWEESFPMISLVRAGVAAALLVVTPLLSSQAASAADKAFRNSELADSAVKLEAQIKFDAGTPTN